MADRTAAGIFGSVFEILDSEQGASSSLTIQAVALEVWKLSKRYDFTPDQMSGDDDIFPVLERLGIDPEEDDL